MIYFCVFPTQPQPEPRPVQGQGENPVIHIY